jgi:hypothetical protein
MFSEDLGRGDSGRLDGQRASIPILRVWLRCMVVRAKSGLCGSESWPAGSCELQAGGCREMLVLSRKVTSCWRNNTLCGANWPSKMIVADVHGQWRSDLSKTQAQHLRQAGVIQFHHYSTIFSALVIVELRHVFVADEVSISNRHPSLSSCTGPLVSLPTPYPSAQKFQAP